jgi:CheY-like chemotaxis protein
MHDPIRILLADDDIDDCMLFGDALADLDIEAALSTLNDGEQLIRRLFDEGNLPDILFLDLNMPRKNGFDCLSEIKANESTRSLPVVIISTSFNPDIVKLLHARGARHYVRKPEDFESLKSVINKALVFVTSTNQQANFNQFVIHPQ